MHLWHLKLGLVGIKLETKIKKKYADVEVGTLSVSLFGEDTPVQMQNRKLLKQMHLPMIPQEKRAWLMVGGSCCGNTQIDQRM